MSCKTTTLRKCGKEVDSERYWFEQAADYVNVLDDAYHAHRLRVIDALIPQELYAPGRRIFDFGCGDAVHFPRFLDTGAAIEGVDRAPEMIECAQARLAGRNAAALVEVGDVGYLERLDRGKLDALLSFNVLAYLTDEEERVFYAQAHRVLKPEGQLIVTHSNELFDMFSLNGYTVEFFNRHLLPKNGARDGIGSLLSMADTPKDPTSYNIRENPLTYRFKLAAHGFEEVQQEFSNRHDAPPPIMPNTRDYPDTLGVPEHERWKLMFVCSTFGSRSVRR